MVLDVLNIQMIGAREREKIFDRIRNGQGTLMDFNNFERMLTLLAPEGTEQYGKLLAMLFRWQKGEPVTEEDQSALSQLIANERSKMHNASVLQKPHVKYLTG